MTKSNEVHGVVHGKTIELEQETGLPDGQPVSVIVQPVPVPGDGIRRSAGMWNDGAEGFEEWEAEVERSRQLGRTDTNV